jgi:hypothetical protein
MSNEELIPQNPITHKNRRRSLNVIAICLVLALGCTLGLTFARGKKQNASEINIYQPQGKLVIPAQFSSPSFFHNGMTEYSTRNSDTPLFTSGGAGQPLKLNFTEDLYGLISSDGKITPPKFKLVGSFESGIAPAEDKNGLMGAIDKNGRWVISPQYRDLSDFIDGLSSFTDKQSGNTGYINTKGKVIIKPIYKSGTAFTEKRAMVCLDGNSTGISMQCGFIDEKGQAISKMEYSSYSSLPYSEGYAMVCKGINKAMRCGFLNYDGSIATPIAYPAVQDENGLWSSPLSSFSGGYSIFGGYWDKGGFQKWGLLNKKFKYQIEPIFTKEISKYGFSPYDFDAGVQWQTIGRTKDNPGRTAAVDKNGNVLFYSNYDEVQSFTNGISPVRIGNKWGFVNQKNQLVIKPQYDDTRGYSEGLAAVRINGYWGYIN